MKEEVKQVTTKLNDRMDHHPQRQKIIYWIFFAVVLSAVMYSVYLQHQKLRLDVVRLNSELEHQKQILAGLQTAQHAQSRLLEEIRHWLEMANFELVVSRNVSAAVYLLQTAERAITHSNDSALSELQKILGKNIGALQAIPALDIENVVLRIEKISDEIGGLPLIPTQVKPAETVLPPASALPIQERFLEAILAILRESVIIRHHALPLEPLLPPTQQAYLITNIRSQLDQASWAALHGQPLVYQHAISQAIKWIRQYYREDFTPVQDILQRLNALQKIDVKPVLPGLNDLLKKLDELS
jgi:uncharacterized protein HemX